MIAKELSVGDIFQHPGDNTQYRVVRPHKTDKRRWEVDTADGSRNGMNTNFGSEVILISSSSNNEIERTAFGYEYITHVSTVEMLDVTCNELDENGYEVVGVLPFHSSSIEACTILARRAKEYTDV